MAHALPNPVDVLVDGATFRADHGPMIVAKVDPAGQAIAEGDLDTHFGQLQANWNEDLALGLQAAIGSVARTVFAADVGEDLTLDDVVLSGGWGDDAQAAATIAAGSRDGRGRITIIADGGNYAANPTVTITFRGGAFAAAPWPMAQQVGGTGARATVDSSATTTTLTLTWRGTPVDGLTYILAWRLDR